VPITWPVDPQLPAGEVVTFDVTVSQDCSEGRVTGTVLGRLQLRGLDELTSAASPLLGGVREYSLIEVATGTLTPAAGVSSPVVLRSTSSVAIANAISLSASGRTGGPAGGTGGARGVGMGGPGAPGTGPMPGLTSGAPGGFDSSDPGLSTLDNPNRSSGGAGGNGVSSGSGGDGGGGGGSIEISAGGDLRVAAIAARGAAGQTGSGGAAGGGGSGGVILLRAGGSLTAGDLDVRSGGTGASGRARYDAGGMATVSPGELGTDHLRGPMFVQPPYSVVSARPTFRVAGKPLTGFRYFFITPGRVSQLVDALFDPSGSARVTLSEDLVPGMNQVCLLPDRGAASSETRNCLYVAYLP
jgi:hypothetical protein